MKAKEPRNIQKKIAFINDISGFGRCSVTAALPVVSAMGVQGCILPTAVFSNHTGYESFYFDDYTDRMRSYMREWEKLHLRFDGICVGFLASSEQTEIVDKCIDLFAGEDTVILIDPVMGDDGVEYSPITSEITSGMRTLMRRGDIATPNITEACFLTGMEYKESWRMAELECMADALGAMGPSRIVISGILQGNSIANYCWQKGEGGRVRRVRAAGGTRAGTGDVFSAILAADAVMGVPLCESVEKASDFVRRSVLSSMRMQLPPTDGICFEEHLGWLAQRSGNGNTI